MPWREENAILHRYSVQWFVSCDGYYVRKFDVAWTANRWTAIMDTPIDEPQTRKYSFHLSRFYSACVANYRRVFYLPLKPSWHSNIPPVNFILMKFASDGGLQITGWNLRLRHGIRNFRVIWCAIKIERSRGISCEIRYSFLGIAN